MDSLSGLFWDFGSLYQRRCGVVSDALSRQPSSSSTSLRRLRLGVAAQACGTSLSDISASPDVAASCFTRRRATATSTLPTCRGAACEINASHTIRRRYLVMARPRASCSSSHRDERREGCGVWHACLGTSGGLRRQFNSIFLTNSQLVRLSFIVCLFSSFLHGTLKKRDPGKHWNTLEPRVIVYLSRSTPRLISTFSQIRDVVSILRPHGCESNASHTQRSGCEINASHTQGSGCEINASHSTSRRHLVMDRPRASRSSSHCGERWEGCRGLTCMLGDVWTIAHSRRHLSPRASSRHFLPLSSRHPGP